MLTKDIHAHSKKEKYSSAFIQYLALCTVFFGVLYFFDLEHTFDHHYDFIKFDRTVSYSSKPPIAKTDWQPTTLPERIPRRFVEENFPPDKNWTSLWYRKSFNGTDLEGYDDIKNKTWSVYIIAPHGSVQIYLNDSLIGKAGRVTPPIPYYRRPVMFTFPRELIKPEGNTIYYQSVRGSRLPWPNHISIGPSSLFEERYENRIFFQTIIPSALLVMMAVLTLFMSMIFYLRPKDKVYGWYSLATFVWMIHHGMKLIDHVPFENIYIWNSLSYWSLGLFVAFGTHYISYFSNLRSVKINRFIFWWAILGGVFLFLIGIFAKETIHTFAEYVWVPSILICGIYAVTILILSFKRTPNAENKHLLLAISILTTVGFRDYLYDFTDLVPGTTFYIQFAAGFVIIYWALILIRRFAFALDTSETLNLELENRVAEKSQELKSFYDSEAESNREKAILDERKRIMRDMHDGLGGQLVQLVTIANKNPALEPVRDNLQMLLTDLRLIIDSLTIDDGDIANVLGAFRYRTEPLLKKVGLSYNWQVQDIPEVHSIGPTAILQILRILQESITNATKHSGASTITLLAGVDKTPDGERFVKIDVKDNGKGMANDQQGELDSNKYGHGLNNMKYRAISIGATLKIINSEEGVTVRITLPC